MRDSTTAADIPVKGTQLTAGYGNGIYKWSAADWARFPAVPHVTIDVNGSDPAGCGVLDVETGDATPAQAPGWAKRRHQLHPGAYPPVIYCNRSTLTPVFNMMAAAGLHVVKDFRLWIATLDNTRTVPDMTGVTAVQYAGQAQTGGHYDESIVYDAAWHAAAPVPPPPPAQLDGVTVWQQGGQLHSRGVISADSGKTWT
jgi:hypothetical protein